MYSFIWIFIVPNIENESEYISFIDKTIKVRLPDRQEEPNLFDLFKTHQVHAHSRTCWKMVEINASFHFRRYFTKRAIISKPF